MNLIYEAIGPERGIVREPTGIRMGAKWKVRNALLSCALFIHLERSRRTGKYKEANIIRILVCEIILIGVFLFIQNVIVFDICPALSSNSCFSIWKTGSLSPPYVLAFFCLNILKRPFRCYSIESSLNASWVTNRHPVTRLEFIFVLQGKRWWRKRPLKLLVPFNNSSLFSSVPCVNTTGQYFPKLSTRSFTHSLRRQEIE